MLKFLKYFIFIVCPLMAEQSPSTPTKEAPPYATCWIAGQLGNEMCQISTTLAYAWDNNLEPRFPELNQTQWNISYNRDHFFFRLNTDPLPRPPQEKFGESNWWTCNPIPPGQDVYLKGIFFNKNRFHHHLDKLRQVYAPSAEVEKYLKHKFRHLIAHPKTCSVHVRTYGKDAVEKHGCIFIGLDYYRAAMALFPPDTLFVFFSDRIQWCKHAFKDFPYDMVFVEGNNHIQDFHLMSKMHDHIIGNSEFSWWASYLDPKPNKRIVAPQQWYKMGKNGYVPYEKDTLFFPDWIVLDVEINAPYPTDMRDYEAHSTSTDTE